MDVWVWPASVATALLLLAAAALRILTLALPIFERPPPLRAVPPVESPGAEPVRFATTDGLTLAGSLHRPAGSPRGLIVFCPEYGGTHESAPAYAAGLIDAGFAVLAFDFRNQGESDFRPGYRPSHWPTEQEVADVLAAVRYVAERADLAGLSIGLFGVSRGGSTALAAASRSDRVGAVAAEGAFSTDAMMAHYAYRWAELYVPHWVMRTVPGWYLALVMRFVRRVAGFRRGVRYAVLERDLPRLAGRPVLLIAGEKDSYVPTAVAERIRERIGPGCIPVWVVPGAKHNQARPAATEEYDRRLAACFSRIAPPRPTFGRGGPTAAGYDAAASAGSRTADTDQ